MKTGTALSPIPEEIFEATGKLCAAWSYLEFATEKTIWGTLGVLEQAGREYTWPLDLRQRWKLIIKEAPVKHTNADQQFLASINNKIDILCRDRNIIVHGLIHAVVKDPSTQEGVVTGGTFDRQPAWSIFRGINGGKSYPMSLRAIEVVRDNIGKTTKLVAEFNERHHYTEKTTPSDLLEKDWPKPF